MSTPATNPDAPLFGVAQNVNRKFLTMICWGNVLTAAVFLALRLCVRWRRNHYFLHDDYWMIFAWLNLLTLAIVQMEQMESLWYIIKINAKHFLPASEEESRQHTEQWLRWSYPFTYLFWTGLFAVKASLMTVFYHLVSPIAVLRKTWYLVAIFTFLSYVGGWLSGTLICNYPPDYFVAGKCSSPKELWLGHFAIFYTTVADIITDVMIMALPIAVLPSLQLDLRKKICLGVVFSLALITILTAIIRMTQVLKGETVDLVGLAVWSITELGVAIIVGSLPPLKSLFSRGIKRYNRSKTNNPKAYVAGPAGNGNYYGPDTTSRSVMVAESIPLDERHRSGQFDGGIYVQRTCEVYIEGDETTRSDEEEVIVKRVYAVSRPS